MHNSFRSATTTITASTQLPLLLPLFIDLLTLGRLFLCCIAVGIEQTDAYFCAAAGIESADTNLHLKTTNSSESYPVQKTNSVVKKKSPLPFSTVAGIKICNTHLKSDSEIVRKTNK